MDGRAFLDVAADLAAGPTEPYWRAAAGRAYYTLMHEGLAALLRWGFMVSPRENVHHFVRLRFNVPAHVDAKKIGRCLDRLSRLRNEADYQLATPGSFTSAHRCQQAVSFAHDAITLLDQLETDPVRRSAAIAAIRAAFPP